MYMNAETKLITNIISHIYRSDVVNRNTNLTLQQIV